MRTTQPTAVERGMPLGGVMGVQTSVSPASRRVPQIALSKTQAAQTLGVSLDFFDDHIAAELRCVHRGRRRLYPVKELNRWLEEESAVRPAPGVWDRAPRR